MLIYLVIHIIIIILFSYCGHGTGLQYLDGVTLLQMELNSIVFLFGCSSVAFINNGLNSPMTASHLFYHMAHCPTVLGSNFALLDIDSDLIASLIFAKFFKSNAKNDWSGIDVKSWKQGKLSEFNFKYIFHYFFKIIFLYFYF